VTATRSDIRFLLLLSAVLPVAARRSSAAETWSWNTAEFRVLRTSRWQASGLFQLRTGNGLGVLRQKRAGANTRLRIGERIDLLANYNCQRDKGDLTGWWTTHRLQGGVEASVLRKGRVAVNARGLLDRIMPQSAPDFNRYRARLRLSTTSRVGPYAGFECLFLRTGLTSVRYAAGLRWRATRDCALEGGYLYDARRTAVGPSRHVIETRLTFDGLRLYRR
jgi:hypothetical protein